MKPVLDAYVPSAPSVLANDYDPDFGRVSGSTPATRLLAELVKGALNDLRGPVIGEASPRARSAARAASCAWLHDPDGIDEYGTAAFCFDRLGIDHCVFVARLDAGQIGHLWLRRSGGPYRLRKVRAWAERKRKREVAA